MTAIDPKRKFDEERPMTAPQRLLSVGVVGQTAALWCRLTTHLPITTNSGEDI
ncbi:hypothetical protein SAMN05443545_11011 [Aidingimonas halophila]|uniref:Uncharacterized protein n=1 Tax=Aidingimonas halophila TaxID=574349 RepID=A0A1H3GNX5_9GAMM|nr:hypothetical protein SAMN05443545_11011 [Aidingimonas halophila]